MLGGESTAADGLLVEVAAAVGACRAEDGDGRSDLGVCSGCGERLAPDAGSLD